MLSDFELHWAYTMWDVAVTPRWLNIWMNGIIQEAQTKILDAYKVDREQKQLEHLHLKDL